MEVKSQVCLSGGANSCMNKFLFTIILDQLLNFNIFLMVTCIVIFFLAEYHVAPVG